MVKSSCWRQSATIGRPKKPCAHRFISAADFFGDAQEAWVFGDRKLEVALVVERHGIDLPEGVLAIEHPAVSAREQSVGDVAQAALGARPWPSGRTGALDPLAHQIGRDLAPVEVSVASVLNADARPRNQRLGIEEGNALPAALPRQSPRDAPCHQLVSVTVERRQNLQRLKRRRGVDLGVRLEHAFAVIESSRQNIFFYLQKLNAQRAVIRYLIVDGVRSVIGC